MSEELVIAAYNAGYDTRKHEKDYDPMGSSDVCAAISRLDSQSAYIEELTEALYLALPYVECYEGDDDFKQDKIKRDSKLIRNVLANPSTTTSLEQVKMDSAYKAVMGILDMDYWCETPTGGSAYSENQIIEYANNLKEQG